MYDLDGFLFGGTDLKTGVQGTQDMDNEVRNDALHMLIDDASLSPQTHQLAQTYTRHKRRSSSLLQSNKRAAYCCVPPGVGGGRGVI